MLHKPGKAEEIVDIINGSSMTRIFPTYRSNHAGFRTSFKEMTLPVRWNKLSSDLIVFIKSRYLF